jgi:hypothetical protein
MRVKRTANQLLARAFHEAGHAVATHVLQIPLAKEGAIIFAGEGFSGLVKLQRRFLQRLGRLDSVELTDANRVKAERWAIMYLAGLEAQKKYSASSVRNYHAAADYSGALDLMSYFAPETKELQAYIRLLQLRARSLVEFPPHWAAIQAVASALMEKHTLSASEVTTVIFEAFQCQAA